MSSSMSSELLATYAGLGTHDGDHYYKGEECLGEALMYGRKTLRTALTTCEGVHGYRYINSSMIFY